MFSFKTIVWSNTVVIHIRGFLTSGDKFQVLKFCVIAKVGGRKDTPCHKTSNTQIDLSNRLKNTRRNKNLVSLILNTNVAHYL
jgi:hypothetical protein